MLIFDFIINDNIYIDNEIEENDECLIFISYIYIRILIEIFYIII